MGQQMMKLGQEAIFQGQASIVYANKLFEPKPNLFVKLHSCPLILVVVVKSGIGPTVQAFLQNYNFLTICSLIALTPQHLIATIHHASQHSARICWLPLPRAGSCSSIQLWKRHS